MKMSRLILAITITSVFLVSIVGLVLAAESPDELRTQAYTYQQDGDTDKAIELYEQALSLKPSARLCNDLGVCYEEKGLADEAEEYYLKAAKFKGAYAAAHANLALLYEDQGELAKAAYHWQKRLDLAKDGDKWADIAKEHLSSLPKIKFKVAKETKRAPQEPAQKPKPKPKKGKPPELNKDMPPYSPYIEKPQPPKEIEKDGNRGRREELIEKEIRRLTLSKAE